MTATTAAGALTSDPPSSPLSPLPIPRAPALPAPAPTPPPGPSPLLLSDALLLLTPMSLRWAAQCSTPYISCSSYARPLICAHRWALVPCRGFKAGGRIAPVAQPARVGDKVGSPVAAKNQETRRLKMGQLMSGTNDEPARAMLFSFYIIFYFSSKNLDFLKHNPQ
jgi:hypothetical protein